MVLKKESRRPNYSSGLRSPRFRYFPKQWMINQFGDLLHHSTPPLHSTTLLPTNFCFRLARKWISIQYAYRKCGTRAQVFSRTLAHGNSKIERQRNRGRRQEEKTENAKEKKRHQNKWSSRRPKYSSRSALPSPQRCHSLKLRMNYLTNLTYTYNPSASNYPLGGTVDEILYFPGIHPLHGETKIKRGPQLWQ